MDYDNGVINKIVNIVFIGLMILLLTSILLMAVHEFKREANQLETSKDFCRSYGLNYSNEDTSCYNTTSVIYQAYPLKYLNGKAYFKYG